MTSISVGLVLGTEFYPPLTPLVSVVYALAAFDSILVKIISSMVASSFSAGLLLSLLSLSLSYYASNLSTALSVLSLCSLHELFPLSLGYSYTAVTLQSLPLPSTTAITSVGKKPSDTSPIFLPTQLENTNHPSS